MGIYETDFICDFRNLKSDLSVSFPKLITFMQETALRHSADIGYSMDWFAENHCGFAVTHWQVEVISYPRWNEKIVCRTWPVGFKGFMGGRCFEILSAEGGILARANSNWFFTDTLAKRPKRMDKLMIETYGAINRYVMETDYKLPELADFELIGKTDITIKNSDIDMNHHVNNVRYIEWFVDLLDIDFFEIKNLREMKAVYKKECVFGDIVHMELWRGEGQYIGILKNSDDITLTEIYSRWD